MHGKRLLLFLTYLRTRCHPKSIPVAPPIRLKSPRVARSVHATPERTEPSRGRGPLESTSHLLADGHRLAYAYRALRYVRVRSLWNVLNKVTVSIGIGCPHTLLHDCVGSRGDTKQSLLRGTVVNALNRLRRLLRGHCTVRPSNSFSNLPG